MKACAAAVLFALLSLISTIYAADLAKIKAEHAVIDFSNTTIAPTDTVALDGRWNFYWLEFISPEGHSRTRPVEVPVRGTWKELPYEKTVLPADGWAS